MTFFRTIILSLHNTDTYSELLKKIEIATILKSPLPVDEVKRKIASIFFKNCTLLVNPKELHAYEQLCKWVGECHQKSEKSASLSRIWKTIFS